MQKRTRISDLFYCHHLGAGETDEKDIQKFEVRDEKGIGLLEYITECAFADENEGKMRTYLVRDRFSSDIVGYFSLKAGLVSYNEHEVVEINEKTGQPIVDEITGKMKFKRVFDTLPGVELADFAINQAFIDKHSEYKGVGLIIYDSFVLPIVVNTARNIGIKILYLYALPYEELISRYKEYGFKRLGQKYEKEIHSRLKPKYDKYCIFMYRILD